MRNLITLLREQELLPCWEVGGVRLQLFIQHLPLVPLLPHGVKPLPDILMTHLSKNAQNTFLIDDS